MKFSISSTFSLVLVSSSSMLPSFIVDATELMMTTTSETSLLRGGSGNGNDIDGAYLEERQLAPSKVSEYVQDCQKLKDNRSVTSSHPIDIQIINDQCEGYTLLNCYLVIIKVNEEFFFYYSKVTKWKYMHTSLCINHYVLTGSSGAG